MNDDFLYNINGDKVYSYIDNQFLLEFTNDQKALLRGMVKAFVPVEPAAFPYISEDVMHMYGNWAVTEDNRKIAEANKYPVWRILQSGETTEIKNDLLHCLSLGVDVLNEAKSFCRYSDSKKRLIISGCLEGQKGFPFFMCGLPFFSESMLKCVIKVKRFMYHIIYA